MLFGRADRVNDTYDVVVIGSGLGGMTSANILAKGGKKVLLLEAHNKLGGLATWFFRSQKQFIFDVSLHGFPAGMKKTCRKYWSKEIADDIVQLKGVRFSNPQFELETDYTKVDFKNILVGKFGINIETVEDFFKYVESLNFYDDISMTNRELFEKFFPGRNDVVRLLMEPITYANGSTLDDPAVTYGIVFSNFMGSGVYTFVGGTDQLIKKMQGILLENNVDIKMQGKVSKILMNDNGSVRGVELDAGQIVEAKAVVSNANLYNTIFKMTGEQYFQEDFKAAAKAVRMNSSSCQVYMAIKKGQTIPHLGDLLFTSTCPTYDDKAIMDFDITSRTFSFYYPESRPDMVDAPTTIVASMNARYEDWKKLSEEEYEAAKKKMMEDCVVSLEKWIPDLRDKLEFVDAATPLTVEHYTHHHQGAAFGTKFEGLKVSQQLPKEAKGLFHAGSVGIIMSGWLGAANYGVIVSNEVDRYLNEK
ncbi:MAG: FAD-dependent oxidoreductase [Bacteriovoracaceae bacterium]|nr:FAD-dependent oxidoreductase [Bacteriovoracaceae bacterium]